MSNIHMTRIDNPRQCGATVLGSHQDAHVQPDTRQALLDVIPSLRVKIKFLAVMTACC